MLKKRIRILALAGVLSCAAVPALATYPVFDATSFGKLIEQVNALKKQFDELMKQTQILGEISKTAQDQINAIGAIGQVALPLVNLQKLGQQINRDVTCLLPDFSKLMPGVDLEGLDWESICARRFFYDSTLWFDPSDPDSWQFGEGGGPEDWSMPDGGTWGGSGNGGDWKNPDTAAGQALYFKAYKRALKEVETRRAQIAREAVNTGLAQADRMTDEQSETNLDAINELDAQAEQALDLKKLLMALFKAMSHQNRMQVQQQQQMAQLIRIQSAMLMQFGSPKSGVPEEAEE